jgi:hypothetical protein
MSSQTLHPFAADYLDRLRRAGRGLPPERLRELVADIEAHLSEAIDPGASDAEALTVIDRLGEPEAIIAAEARRPDELPVRRGQREWAAIVLLLLGGFIFGVGWFAGLILLWTSRFWTRREKWIGTLVIPGGLATSFVFGVLVLSAPTKRICYAIGNGAHHCANAPGQSHNPSVLGVAGLVVLVVAPIATAIYLARRSA